ncbi:MAG: hypothetical protein QOD39_5184, partial [Mycobacterium sp.]|nr:hypothetical protein [Mycobacterium sp.]
MSGGLDQVFSSVSNGLIVFAVAVAASPVAVGNITILITVLMAVLSCLRGGLGLPLLQTAHKSVEEIRESGSRALAAALAVSPLLAIGLLAMYPLAGFAALALAVSAPFVIGQDMLRYVALTIGRPHVAAIWDGVWCVGAMLTLVLAWLRLPFVTAATVLAFWGVLGLIAFVAMTVDLKLLPSFRGIVGWLKANWQDRVRYGVDAGLEQSALLIIFVLVSALMSADATGALRGAMALFAPIGIFGAAVQMVLIPESARSSASPRQVWGLLRPIALLTALVTAAIGVVGYLLPSSIGFYLLGESFESARGVLIPITAWFVASCFTVVIGIQLKTFNRSSELFKMKISSCAVQLVVAAGAAVWIGSASGVAVWLAIQTFATALFFYFLWPPGGLEPRL